MSFCTVIQQSDARHVQFLSVVVSTRPISLPLVPYDLVLFSVQCRELNSELSKATRGEAFVLMGGDCAESFSEFKVRPSSRFVIVARLQHASLCSTVFASYLPNPEPFSKYTLDR